MNQINSGCLDVAARDEIDNYLWDATGVDKLFESKSKSPANNPKFNKLSNKYVFQIFKAADDGAGQAAGKINKILAGLGIKDLGNLPDYKKIRMINDFIDICKDKLELSPSMSEAIAQKITELFRFGKKEPFAPSFVVKLTLKDKRAIRWLEDSDKFYVGKVFPKHREQIVALLRDEVFQRGIGTGEAVRLVKDRLPKAVQNNLHHYEAVIRTSANRTRNWSRFSSFESLDVERIEIVTMRDERVSEICQAMDGKIFEVKKISPLIDNVMNSDPEEIPDINPFPTVEQAQNMTPEMLVDSGIGLPPYHVRCRTIYVIGEG